MDYADKLREKRDRYVVAFRKFVSLFPSRQEDIYCFVEGKDDSLYYGPQIYNMYKRNEFQFMNCTGKQGVIRLSELICKSNEYKNAKTFFFVDSDFDDRIHDSNIYETPCYSIENLYTSTDVLKKILKCEFQLTDGDEDFNKTIETYRESQNQFHDSVLLLNVWLCCQKELGVRLNIDENLKNEVFHRIVNIKIERVEQKYNINKLYEIFPNSTPIDNSVLDNKLSEFNKSERNRKFRGKFELLFLKKFLEQISADANKKKPEFFKERVRNSVNLAGNLLSTFSKYAEVPECLNRYLSKYIPVDQNSKTELIISVS